MRIALIHALRASVTPINEAFARLWPQAVLMNLLDDSLSADLARGADLDRDMTPRFLTLARYARSTGADGILFTCSAFGPCIEACAADLPIPVLKPTEAMIEDAEAYARVGVLATFGPTLVSLPPEFGRPVETKLAEGAMAALAAGNPDEHDRLSAEAAKSLAGCDVIALAQFSLARAADQVAKATGKMVLSTPDSAVRKLQRLLG